MKEMKAWIQITKCGYHTDFPTKESYNTIRFPHIHSIYGNKPWLDPHAGECACRFVERDDTIQDELY